MVIKHPHIELDYAFQIRHAELSDIDDFYQLVKVADAEFYGQTTTTKAHLLSDWQMPNFDLARNSRLVYAPSGALIGFSLFFDAYAPMRPHVWSYVHREWRRLGVGTALIEWAIARAKENRDSIPDDARLVLSTGVYETNQSAKELLESLGFATEHFRINMYIELEDAPQRPTFPEGIRIIPYNEFGNLREVYRVLKEAFRDHRGHIDQDFETAYARFEHEITTNPSVDFSLWFLAMDGDALIGIALCAPTAWDDNNKGWVDELGVLQAYRKQGIGRGLLQHSFCQMFARGIKKVGLNADGSNLTGAVRLYHDAGMRVFRRWDIYEKVLREGKEYTKQD